jgi:transposase
LLSGQRKKLSEIGALLDTTPVGVSRWIRRYEAGGVDGLYDRPRSGRPAKADTVYEARLVELVAASPGKIDSECPWGVWTVGRLAARMEHEGFRAVSDDTVRRVLHRRKYAFLRPKLDLKHKQDPKKVRAFLRRLRKVKRGWSPIPA